MKDQFKFDLAMYTAYSQAAIPPRRAIKNPTVLGDSVLRLIKAIVAKRGDFSYRNLARLFLEQTKAIRYETFKTYLPRYLLYQVSGTPIAAQIDDHLKTRLDSLYTDFDDQPLDTSLLLRTCNRIIDYLMTEDQEVPSPLFSLVLSQGNALTLAIILLKLVLISRSSQLYLEVRIADLIRYYEQFPRNQCQWVINFLEVFQVTFAIHAENIEYSLVRIDGLDVATPPPLIRSWEDLEAFRVFSQRMRLSPVDFDTLSR
ncbi:MAG TPA: hypothetical protein IGR64_11875 [Leptolyngbyaceae cyanobacterium M65_K2018_010]|nr:hypothetical protein [Leptolyngbyaceae cyanobacterium M65_K2018_010]